MWGPVAYLGYMNLNAPPKTHIGTPTLSQTLNSHKTCLKAASPGEGDVEAAECTKGSHSMGRGEGGFSGVGCRVDVPQP